MFLCFRSKDSVGWELIFSTPYLHNTVERMALNAKVSSSSFGDKMLAVSSGWFFKTEEHMINSTLPQDKGRFNIFITSRDKEKPESPVGF